MHRNKGICIGVSERESARRKIGSVFGGQNGKETLNLKSGLPGEY